ncbi:ABC transporter permease [Thiorhodovibrio frisius]|uniref:Transport permease protein n=1 Tax=Thiorhodovibrio frisius TaxID=631362 RepID=H8Z3A6_9GAMM|nr:ABC transporter permease [Thiorhodovibrio frisius]EIC21814.1 ABC-type multidrug transport system, permease component [Thiorhodovibrio frisius]WPL21784.1 Inner membrane transport permease YbhS [Thiorhodovibrio frisius]
MNALRRILAILAKELLQLRRDRITLAMVIMIPLIQLVLFGFAINTNVRHIPAALVDQSGSALGRVLAQTVEATQVVRFTERYTDIPAAEDAIREGRVRAALIIPPDLAQRVARSGSVRPDLATPRATDQETSRPVAQWLVDASDTVIAGTIKGLRGMPLAALLRQPVNRTTPTFAIALLFNPAQRTVVNIVPGLVGIILTMTMIMFTSAAIVRERERGNMEMLINTPVRPIELMIGKILPYVAIGLVQAGIILGLGRLLFAVPLHGSLLALACLTLVFIGASLALGLVLSTIAKSQLQATQMTIFILLPSILLSGFMFPYEGMPRAAQTIAEALPATHFIRAIRAVLLRDAGLEDIQEDALWLLGFMLIGLLVASLRFKKRLD